MNYNVTPEQHLLVDETWYAHATLRFLIPYLLKRAILALRKQWPVKKTAVAETLCLILALDDEFHGLVMLKVLSAATQSELFGSRFIRQKLGGHLDFAVQFIHRHVVAVFFKVETSQTACCVSLNRYGILLLVVRLYKHVL